MDNLDNLTLLTGGNKIYEKKRKNRLEQVPEVIFDETARRDFLTGFHKRKLERKAKAKETALRLFKQEKAKARKVAKESIKEQVNQRLAKLQEVINKINGRIGQIDEKNEEEINNDNEKINNVKQTEFRSSDTKATVTIIEDFDISDTFENVSKIPRIDDEITDHDKEISSVPTKNSEQKFTSINKKPEKTIKKKRQPRNKILNKSRRFKTKKSVRSKSGQKKRK